MAGVLMGRPKKTREADGGKPKTIGIRVDPTYAEWLERLARFNRSTVSVLFDQAVSAYAKEIGFEEPAPER